jgi:IS30 family transposase
MRQSHYSQAEIARVLDRHPSTISRELRRNRREDGFYRAFTADEKTRARRSRSRRNLQFTEEQWLPVFACLCDLWSPEQISGRLRLLGLHADSRPTFHCPYEIQVACFAPGR